MAEKSSDLRILLTVSLLVIGSVGYSADCRQWGRTNDRNMVSPEQDLPDGFIPPKSNSPEQKNVKWAAKLGTFAYGNPTVSDGRVFVGTDRRTLADKRFKGDKGGLIKCYDEKTGELLWQFLTPERINLPPETHFSQQHLGTCSSATVEGKRLYIVSTRAEILCMDVNGQADGNDGPFKDEAKYMAGLDNPPVELKDTDGDIIWVYDPIEELGVVPHDAASCAVLIEGDFLYTSSSNGVDGPHKKMLAPDAPSLIVLNKNTGKLAASDNEKIGHRMYHCQWTPPSAGEVGGKILIFFGGGDGVCYAFEAITEMPDEPVHLKKVWSYDCNPPEYKYENGKEIPYYRGDKRKSYSTNENDGKYIGPSQLIGTPVFRDGRVYIALGQDPAHGRGRGMLHCIDATKTGDITESGRVWTYDELDRSLATAAVVDGLVYIIDVAGRMHCVEEKTGKKVWEYKTGAEAWGGPLVADGKLYFGNQRRFYVMAQGREAKLISEVRLSAPVYSTPIAANGVLYVASNKDLFAVENK